MTVCGRKIEESNVKGDKCASVSLNKFLTNEVCLRKWIGLSKRMKHFLYSRRSYDTTFMKSQKKNSKCGK